MDRNYRCRQTIPCAAIISLIIVAKAHAFIAFPPITTYSITFLVVFFWLFALSFYCSAMFQGWYMNKQLGIELRESINQAFRVKIFFLLYALPVLVLSDLVGLATLNGFIYTFHLPNSIQNNIWFQGIAYFSVGWAVIVLVASIIEIFLLSKKWNDVPEKRLRSTIVIANALIFAFALATMFLLTEAIK